MKISPGSWHYKLYVFMSQWNAAWLGKDAYWKYPHNSNKVGLCPYIRMIILWGPLAILSNFIPIGVFIASFFLYPASVNGYVGIVWLVTTLLVITAVVLIIGYVRHLIDLHEENRRHSELEYGVYYEKQDKSQETFRSLLWEYLETIKTKMCPVLEVKQDD